MNNLEKIDYGFIWGGATITRCLSDEKKNWVTLLLITKKHPNGIQIYVTKTGKVRIYGGGEWMPKKLKGRK